MDFEFRKNKYLLVALLGVCSSASHAAEFGVSAYYKYRQSDNISQLASGQDIQGGSVHSLYGTLSGSARAKSFSMDGDLKLGLGRSSENDGDTSVEVSGKLFMLYDIQPEHISWIFADYIVQQSGELEALSDEGTRNTSNFLITGPRTHWRLTPVDSVNVDAFFMLGSEEGEDEQTRVLALESDISHRISTQHIASLHYKRSNIFYKIKTDKSTIENIFLRYGYNKKFTSLEIDGGMSKNTSDQEQLNESTSRSLLRLSLNRELSRELSVGAEASQTYNDEVNSSIRNLQGNQSTNLSIDDGTFYEERLGLSVSRDGVFTSTDLMFSKSNIEYQAGGDTLEDRDVTRLYAGLNYSMSDISLLRLSLNQLNIDYTQVERVDKEFSVGIGFDYSLAQAWGLGLDVISTRTSSVGIDEATQIEEQSEFVENEISFRVTWQPKSKVAEMRKKYKTKTMEDSLL